MYIGINLKHYDKIPEPGETKPGNPFAPPDPLFEWRKYFVRNTIHDEETFERSLGYMTGLVSLKYPNTKLEFLYRGGPEDETSFMRSVHMRPHILTRIVRYPIYNEDFNNFIIENKIPNPKMNYAMILYGDNGGNVRAFQFNHLEFLRGYLSILRGSNINPADRIYAIYDRQGTRYNIVP